MNAKNFLLEISVEHTIIIGIHSR